MLKVERGGKSIEKNRAPCEEILPLKEEDKEVSQYVLINYIGIQISLWPIL